MKIHAVFKSPDVIYNALKDNNLLSDQLVTDDDYDKAVEVDKSLRQWLKYGEDILKNSTRDYVGWASYETFQFLVGTGRYCVMNINYNYFSNISSQPQTRYSLKRIPERWRPIE